MWCREGSGDWRMERRGSRQSHSRLPLPESRQTLDILPHGHIVTGLSLALALASAWYAHLSPSALVLFPRSNEGRGSLVKGWVAGGAGAGVEGAGTLPGLAPLGSLPLPEGGGGGDGEDQGEGR